MYCILIFITKKKIKLYPLGKNYGKKKELHFITMECQTTEADQSLAPEAAQNHLPNSLPFHETPSLKLVEHLEVYKEI